MSPASRGRGFKYASSARNYFTAQALTEDGPYIANRIDVWPDRVLWYAKGGLAIGEIRAQTRCNTDSQQVIPILGGGLLNPACPAAGTTRTDVGWTVGGGSELALTDNWSVKAETSYFNLGTGRYLADPPVQYDVKRVGWISTIGLNYRFTGFGEAPAIVAKY